MIQPSVVYKSLFSRSPIIKFGFFIGVAITAMSLCFGTAYLAISFLFVVCLGLGVSVQNYRRWEGFELVPGFKQSQTTAAIQISACLTIITLMFVVFLHGFSMPLIGLVFLAAGVGLNLCQHAYLSLLILPCIISFEYINLIFRNKQLIDRIVSNQYHCLDFFGASGILCGLIGHFYFYQRTTAKNDGALHGLNQRNRVSSSPSKTPQSDFLLTPSQGNSWIRSLSLLSPFSALADRHSIKMLVIGIAVLAILSLGGRQSEFYLAGIMFYSAMIFICCPVVLFSHHLRKSFAKAWILGIANDRKTTASRLTQLTAFQSLVVAAIVIAGLAVLLPIQFPTLGNTIILLTAASVLGALCLLIAISTFRYWHRYADSAFLVFIVVSTIVAGICVPLVEKILVLLNHSTNFGQVYSLSMVAMLFAWIVIWKACFVTATHTVANQASLME